MESTWEGVDRKKAQVVTAPPAAAASDGASAAVESTAEGMEEFGAAYALEDEVRRAVRVALGSALPVLGWEERIGLLGFGGDVRFSLLSYFC